MLFAPAGLSVRSSPETDRDDPTKPAAPSVAVLGQGFLLVRSRPRITHDGGQSLMAIHVTHTSQGTNEVSHPAVSATSAPANGNGLRNHQTPALATSASSGPLVATSAPLVPAGSVQTQTVASKLSAGVGAPTSAPASSSSGTPTVSRTKLVTSASASGATSTAATAASSSPSAPRVRILFLLFCHVSVYMILPPCRARLGDPPSTHALRMLLVPRVLRRPAKSTQVFVALVRSASPFRPPRPAAQPSVR
jgi:hypothetical protein